MKFAFHQPHVPNPAFLLVCVKDAFNFTTCKAQIHWGYDL